MNDDINRLERFLNGGANDETEAAIQRSLDDRLVIGRTSLIIAHRLSTVRRAHLIHVLEDGRIVESGTHESLLAQGGQYAALWRLQTGEVPLGADPTSARAAAFLQ